MSLRQRSTSSDANEPSNINGKSNLTKDKGKSWGEAFQFSLFHTTVGPLLLMVTTPLTIVFAWIICVRYDGSIIRMIQEVTKDQLLSIDYYPLPSPEAAKIVGVFAIMQAIFLALLPGPIWKGQVTRTGFQPTYKLNGVLSFFLTHIVLYVVTWQLKWFSLSIVYDHFGEILNTLSVASFITCFFLYFKGLYFPSSPDHGSTGNIVLDFFWGTELHPHIGYFNIKQFSNCRLGMMGWSVIINCFLVKQFEIYGYVSNSMWISTGIQQFYILKFFYWESGYFNTLDIMYDRLGFYIYWGVTCWIPGVYCLVSLYLVKHPYQYSLVYVVAIIAFGIVSVLANYSADEQKIRVRETNGNTTIWGQKPNILKATYYTSDGKERTSLLLYNGWWGISRHVHYIPEILLSIAWTLPAGFSHALPWFYVVYLTILLVHRLGRDEIRCSEKYGKNWKEYCQKVPYRLIPYVF